MSERCSLQGRQQAIQPSKGQIDDGAVSFADLAARGARRIAMDAAQQAPAELAAEAGGYAASAAPTHEHAMQVMEAFEDLGPPSPPEEDPFGFNQLGFDDLEIVGDVRGLNPSAV